MQDVVHASAESLALMASADEADEQEVIDEDSDSARAFDVRSISCSGYRFCA